MRGGFEGGGVRDAPPGQQAIMGTGRRMRKPAHRPDPDTLARSRAAQAPERPGFTGKQCWHGPCNSHVIDI